MYQACSGKDREDGGQLQKAANYSGHAKVLAFSSILNFKQDYINYYKLFLIYVF
jgi:hypothetical protein